MLKKDIRKIKSTQPLYIRLYEHLRKYIESEEARRIGKLPKELELCELFGVSRNTVTQALFMLEEEQLICRIKHRGTYLSSSLNEFDPQSIRRTIGAVFPEGSAWDEAIEAIRSGCRNLGYDFRLFTYPWGDSDAERKIVSKAEKYCGGLIFYSLGTSGSMEYIQEKSGHYPLVLFDLYIVGLKCNLVTTDHFLGAYSLVQTLLEKGCRRFCILKNEKPNSSIRLRSSGYIQALEDHQAGYELIAASDPLLENRLKRGEFDAVLDPGCTHLHFSLPASRIRLARFDQTNEMEQKSFQTLIAKQNKYALGMNAVSLMKDIMRSEMIPERSVLIVPELIEGKEFP